jgi:hypothetical protein
MTTNDEKRPFLIYHGTAHTAYDFRMLADYCRTRPSQPRHEIQELYDREFSMCHSFTFIQYGENPIEPPMEWTLTREDGAVSTFVQ